MSGTSWIVLTVTATAIYLWRHWGNLPEFHPGDAVGFAALGLLALWLVSKRRSGPDDTGSPEQLRQSAAFRLGKTLNRVWSRAGR
jgi:hypothetical protein